MKNLTKRLVKTLSLYALPIALALSPLQAKDSQKEQTVQNTSLDNLVEEKFTYESIPQEEAKKRADELASWLGEDIRIEISRVCSNKNENENLYHVNIKNFKHNDSVPAGLYNNGRIYIINNGLEDAFDTALNSLTNNTPVKRKGKEIFNTLARREFKEYVDKDFSDEKVKEQFAKYFLGNFEETVEKKLIGDSLLEERLHREDTKKGINAEEAEDRALCLRILKGRTLENLGRAYNFSDSEKIPKDYAFYKRFAKYFESQRKTTFESIREDEIKDITRSYLRRYYKDAEELIK